MIINSTKTNIEVSFKKKKKFQALTLRIYFKKYTGGHTDPPRINYLQKAQPKSHKVEIR